MPHGFPFPSLFTLLHPTSSFHSSTNWRQQCPHLRSHWNPYVIPLHTHSQSLTVMALLIQESTVCFVRWARCNVHWIDDANIGDWIRKVHTSGQIYANLISWEFLRFQCFSWVASQIVSNWRYLKHFEAGGAVDAYQSLSRRCIW